ncbi:hypothetical protein GCM10009858_09430 [Terrabacter carboxydivorans]|uniref:Uncharacterized protein n=1 Tax=Terrabacter carboxydivorans TaxID=619730 RepID=A0ABN3KXQ4_9MICO
MTVVATGDLRASASAAAAAPATQSVRARERDTAFTPLDASGPVTRQCFRRSDDPAT